MNFRTSHAKVRIVIKGITCYAKLQAIVNVSREKSKTVNFAFPKKPNVRVKYGKNNLLR